jgi:hypothetical protein
LFGEPGDDRRASTTKRAKPSDGSSRILLDWRCLTAGGVSFLVFGCLGAYLNATVFGNSRELSDMGVFFGFGGAMGVVIYSLAVLRKWSEDNPAAFQKLVAALLAAVMLAVLYALMNPAAEPESDSASTPATTVAE